MCFAPVDEPRVEAERGVVEEDALGDPADVDSNLAIRSERGECTDRVVAVETEIASEVIPGPEWDADERELALDRDLRDGREGPVAACHPERVCLRLPRDLLRLVLRPEDVDLDSEGLGRVDELVCARPTLAGARVHDQKARHETDQPTQRG
jgi:hypothetical protein